MRLLSHLRYSVTRSIMKRGNAGCILPSPPSSSTASLGLSLLEVSRLVGSFLLRLNHSPHDSILVGGGVWGGHHQSSSSTIKRSEFRDKEEEEQIRRVAEVDRDGFVSGLVSTASECLLYAPPSSLPIPPPSFVPSLLTIDASSSTSVKFVAHGNGSPLITSILDSQYKPDLSLPEAVLLIQECFKGAQGRGIINSGGRCIIKVIDQNGVRQIGV
jgi:hypothetical protein